MLTFEYFTHDETMVDFDSLPGLHIAQSTMEKRKNHTIVTVMVNGIVINYLLFHIGLNRALLNVCELLYMLSHDELTEEGRLGIEKLLVKSLWIVKHKNTKKQKSKLAGIWSLSTCCLANTFCLARMKNPCSVCSHCYACTQQRCQFGLTAHNLINGLILMNYEISEKAFAEIMQKKLADHKVFRIESFGDVQNETQVTNYLHFMTACEKVNFAAWTKNVKTWFRAFDRYGKPKNCVFITSSNELNKIDDWNDEKGYVNHTFTVYDENGAKHVKINCGGRACMTDCVMKHKGCYYRDTEYRISEQLK